MTIKQLILLILAGSLVIFSACSNESATEPQDDPVDEFALVAEVGDVYYTEYNTVAGGVNITMDMLFENLTDGDTSDDPFIIDWRASAEYDTRHIKGAVNMSLSELVTKVNDGTIPDDKTIVNVCYSGQTSAQVTAYLRILGYDAYSMLYGVNGCSYTALPDGKPAYHAPDPSDKYVTVLEPAM